MGEMVGKTGENGGKWGEGGGWAEKIEKMGGIRRKVGGMGEIGGKWECVT